MVLLSRTEGAVHDFGVECLMCEPFTGMAGAQLLPSTPRFLLVAACICTGSLLWLSITIARNSCSILLMQTLCHWKALVLQVAALFAAHAVCSGRRVTQLARSFAAAAAEPAIWPVLYRWTVCYTLSCIVWCAFHTVVRAIGGLLLLVTPGSRFKFTTQQRKHSRAGRSQSSLLA
jgi:hypothetical protein